jgi:hypothetical protein
MYGKLKVAINDQVLFDITNQTKDPNLPDKMFYFMPFKVYGTVGYSWITDLEYWDSPPSSSVLSDNGLGIGDLTNLSNSIIYPNPVTTVLNIEEVVLGQKYQIITLTGQVLKTGIFSVQMLDVSELENGMYFMKIINTITKTNKTTRFIKVN